VTTLSDTTAIDFDLEPAAFIKGVVTAGGTPLGNVQVGAYDNTTLQFVAYTSRNTQADGSYTLNVPTGKSYLVQARPSVTGLPYVDEYYDGVYQRNSATPVAVDGQGSTVGGINFSLEPGGSISGVVTATVGGGPVSGATIQVYEYSSLAPGKSWIWYGGATTNSTGGYTVSGLPLGQYGVQASKIDYATEWWENTYLVAAATAVTVTPPGTISGIDFSLEPGGSISGVVTATVGGGPVSGASIAVFEFSSLLKSWVFRGSAVTGPGGGYTVSGLSAGEYGVRAMATNYATEWWQNTYYFAAATAVTVTPPGTTSGINFSLEPGWTISGCVVNSEGVPISGAQIHVYESPLVPGGPGETAVWFVPAATTDSNGYYTTLGLPLGEYTVRAMPAGYAYKWYDNTYNVFDATTITLPGDRTGINFTFDEPGGTISGRVVDTEGAPIPISGALLIAWESGSVSGEWVIYNWANADADGYYTIPGLPTGNYVIQARLINYASEWYRDSNNIKAATPVPVTAPGDTPGIDFIAGPRGTISGRVITAGTGEPTSGALIYVYEYDSLSGELAKCLRVNTNIDGYYTTYGLAAGEYRVQVQAAGYATEWYQESYTQANAKTVKVLTLANTPNIDFSLEPTPVAEAGDPYLVQVNVPVTLNGVAYYDPQRPIASFQWDFGDGSTGNGASANHTYQAAGIYTAKLTVTDSKGASATDSALVVVYDPSEGFVTGGGWILSPEKAYTADPTLTGKATFGFVSKYQKGAKVPTGQTEFQFQVANLNFHSDSYEWLVVAGAKAQYKGTGTINGAGSYRFMLTAIDGDLLAGGKGPDKFRMRIWSDNGLIYDNQLNAPDTDEPTTIIGGGNIVIHK
jgi:PKD repeat protein